MSKLNFALQEKIVERRMTPRLRGSPVPFLVTRDQAAGDHCGGKLMNHSLGGLALCVDRAFTVGTLLSVKPLTGTVDIPWIHVQVKSCRPAEGRWVIGCHWLMPPLAPVIALLG